MQYGIAQFKFHFSYLHVPCSAKITTLVMDISAPLILTEMAIQMYHLILAQILVTIHTALRFAAYEYMLVFDLFTTFRMYALKPIIQLKIHLTAKYYQVMHYKVDMTTNILCLCSQLIYYVYAQCQATLAVLMEKTMLGQYTGRTLLTTQLISRNAQVVQVHIQCSLLIIFTSHLVLAVFASRVCSTTGWQQSIVSHCQSHAFNYVQNQV